MTEGASTELIAVAIAAGELARGLDALTTRRDDAIRAARAAGHSQRQIAEAAGLSHPTVASITRTNPKETSE